LKSIIKHYEIYPIYLKSDIYSNIIYQYFIFHRLQLGNNIPKVNY